MLKYKNLIFIRVELLLPNPIFPFPNGGNFETSNKNSPALVRWRNKVTLFNFRLIIGGHRGSPTVRFPPFHASACAHGGRRAGVVTQRHAPHLSAQRVIPSIKAKQTLRDRGGGASSPIPVNIRLPVLRLLRDSIYAVSLSFPY